MEINVSIKEKFTGCPRVGWLRNVVRRVLVSQKIDTKIELSLVITGQEEIHQLNFTYLGRDRPTDVLSFPMLTESRSKYGNRAYFVTAPDNKKHLGEVIISYPQAASQAREHHHPVEREMAILIIHGILHLLGFDHKKTALKQDMQRLETKILGSLEESLE
ncbi:MAG: rRNA maturation RNase YbeY [Dehalococcoidales bacterium]|jgi:probable rRNA maturation factor|nr:rRNA maturation RNase YbeY [Dehalococcoidales bacterium]MDP6737712.1 rRNA maturation RNase YbeY [Dehalococcoidales bacterium]|tara:strand:+ start:209 stop:691 length:483 start_codon:yes stop_codon:yes gene_type:complete